MTLPDPQNHDDDGDRRPRRVVIWLVVAGIVLTGALVFLMDQYPDALANRLAQPQLVFLVVWLVVLGGSMIVHWRERPGQVLRYIAVWLGIAVVVMLVYRFFTGDFGNF